MALNHDVTNGELVLNFRPVAEGLKQNVDSQFFPCLFLATTAMENTWGAQKFKSRLFLDRSSDQIWSVFRSQVAKHITHVMDRVHLHVHICTCADVPPFP